MQQKRILILTYRPPGFHDHYLNQVEAQIVIQHYDDVDVEFTRGQTRVMVGDRPLNSFDRLFFRGMPGYEEIAALISAAAVQLQIPVVDRVFASQNWMDRKSIECFLLQQQGLPFVESRLISKKRFPRFADQLAYPLVVKHTDGTKGEGVFQCARHEEVLPHFTAERPNLLFQPWIENDGDLRVMVIGNDALGAVKRTRTNPAEFRNNVSAGARCERFPLTPDMAQLAVRAAQCMRYDIAGVDLIFDRSRGEWLILEVNRAPQFAGFEAATGINVARKIMEHIVQSE